MAFWRNNKEHDWKENKIWACFTPQWGVALPPGPPVRGGQEKTWLCLLIALWPIISLKCSRMSHRKTFLHPWTWCRLRSKRQDHQSWLFRLLCLLLYLAASKQNSPGLLKTRLHCEERRTRVCFMFELNGGRCEELCSGQQGERVVSRQRCLCRWRCLSRWRCLTTAALWQRRASCPQINIGLSRGLGGALSRALSGAPCSGPCTVSNRSASITAGAGAPQGGRAEKSPWPAAAPTLHSHSHTYYTQTPCINIYIYIHTQHTHARQRTHSLHRLQNPTLSSLFL